MSRAFFTTRDDSKDAPLAELVRSSYHSIEILHASSVHGKRLAAQRLCGICPGLVFAMYTIDLLAQSWKANIWHAEEHS